MKYLHHAKILLLSPETDNHDYVAVGDVLIATTGTLESNSRVSGLAFRVRIRVRMYLVSYNRCRFRGLTELQRKYSTGLDGVMYTSNYEAYCG